jgi:hypothetical protein
MKATQRRQRPLISTLKCRDLFHKNPIYSTVVHSNYVLQLQYRANEAERPRSTWHLWPAEINESQGFNRTCALNQYAFNTASAFLILFYFFEPSYRMRDSERKQSYAADITNSLGNLLDLVS